MTSFKDSMAFSSVILSGLSSDVCFFMSARTKEMECLVRSRQAGNDQNHIQKAKLKRIQRKRHYRQVSTGNNGGW